MTNLNFNEFAQNCYNAAKAKGFHDRPPNQLQKSAATRFLQVIVTAAKEFEAERKRDTSLMTVIEDSSLESRALVRTALLATELAEAAEWCLEGEVSDQTEYEKYIVGSIHGGTTIQNPNPKPEGFASELADIIIRLGDMSGDLGIDLDYEINRKLAFNATRAYKHGKQF